MCCALEQPKHNHPALLIKSLPAKCHFDRQLSRQSEPKLMRGQERSLPVWLRTDAESVLMVCLPINPVRGSLIDIRNSHQHQADVFISVAVCVCSHWLCIVYRRLSTLVGNPSAMLMASCSLSHYGPKSMVNHYEAARLFGKNLVCLVKIYRYHKIYDLYKGDFSHTVKMGREWNGFSETWLQ